MSISTDLEARLRAKADAEGLTIEAYVERRLDSDQQAERELEALAQDGLRSGDPIEIGPGYWQEKHRRLDERLKKTASW